MLEEFILSQLEALVLNREELTQKMNHLAKQEQEDNDEISRLLAEEDLGMELFSPRSANNGIREQVDTIRKHLQQLDMEQTQIRLELEQITLNESKYQEMLLEVRTRTPVVEMPEEERQVQNTRNTNETVPANEDEQKTNQISAVEDHEEKSTALGIIINQEQNINTDDLSTNSHHLSGDEEDNQTKYDKFLQDHLEKMELMKQEYIDSLETILKRVDNCVDLSHRDKIKCRNELKNLRYYLKAVISKTQK